ncbi:unnamed protein product [Cyprideis torosa]|uniref:Uncharacterized protein n=1 Tax=Cyprideis torosa TaxID=163714 RepID=A0A7R8X0P0_9CRUS|nr:unnamed protein product [Cyprideis torosa]CAG0910920.1 unnamed protein product [Cyprideis torosa]
MEYSHRMWGRAIGIIFFLPAAYFWSRGYLNKGLKVRVVGFGGLIIAQGLLGWYMVKSGLEEERFQDAKDVPRVSHYRLASHLGLAFVLYSLLLWSSLDLLKPALRDGLKQSVATTLKKFRMSAHGTKALIFITAMSVLWSLV